MPETIAPPAVGMAITDIPLIDAHGASSRLVQETLGRPAVVFFMRAADCPVCLGHVRVLGRMLAAGDLGDARVVVVAPGDASDAATARRRIADASLEVRASGTHHADLGLGRFLTLQHSGTFVLDAEGLVRSAVTSALPTASFSKSKVLAALRGA
jgi:peroxiredoxin